MAPSPVSAGNFVIAAANESAPVLAIRADGSGDVTASHVLWKGEDNTPDICSPLATEEFVFLLTSEGMVTCYDARKGDKLWEEDLDDFKCKSSPSLVGKQLYVFGESGKCWILAPTRSRREAGPADRSRRGLRHLPRLPGRPHVCPREEEFVLHRSSQGHTVALPPGEMNV